MRESKFSCTLLGMKITVQQAAEQKQLTPTRIRQLINAGKLSAVKVGMQWMIEAKDVERLVVYNRSGRPRKAKAASTSPAASPCVKSAAA